LHSTGLFLALALRYKNHRLFNILTHSELDRC
jgi:hypothetical protein